MGKASALPFFIVPYPLSSYIHQTFNWMDECPFLPLGTSAAKVAYSSSASQPRLIKEE
jgi:hypothetical protein